MILQWVVMDEKHSCAWCTAMDGKQYLKTEINKIDRHCTCEKCHCVWMPVYFGVAESETF